MPDLPENIESVEQLDDVLTRPSEALVDFVRGLSGRLVVLGAGGKMGPSLCLRARMAVATASGDLEIVAVSRFSDEMVRAQLESAGVKTVACDLLDPDQLAQLPDAANVIYLVGWKFGTSDSPGRTWVANTVAPSLAASRYAGSRIVALSSGNVYPFVPHDCGGANESFTPGPVGEYAWSCLGRERVFEHWSDALSSPTVLLRLNYAVDLRYGVLVDLALRIKAGLPVDLTTGYLNCIWQGDANDLVIRSLSLAESPAAVVNLTGAGTLSVRALAEALASHMEMDVSFEGEEAETSLLNDASLLHSLLGLPQVGIDDLVRWTAHWVGHDLPLLGKPTHFEVRDGRF